MALFLVTGGAGFIGSHLVDELLERGEEVRILDNFSTGKRGNLHRFMNQIEIIEGDIRSYHIIREAVQGVDYILHQAALPSVPRSINDPITSNEVNVGGCLNLLDAARDVGVKRVVYASSSSVYGANSQLPVSEEMAPLPLSPYAVAKLAGENYCRVFTKTYGLSTVCLRYFNVFGPRQDPDSQYAAVIPKFIVAMEQNREILVHGDGTQSRDFTHVDNVVEANILAAFSDQGSGEVFNIACGSSLSLNEIIEKIQSTLGYEGNIKYGKERPGDVKHSLAAIEKARDILGYEPLLEAEEGLDDVLKWFREEK